MSKLATNVWMPVLVRKPFILVDERSFRKYVADALGSVEDCYDRRVVHDGHIEPLGAAIKKHEYCELVEQGKVLLSSNKSKGCVEA